MVSLYFLSLEGFLLDLSAFNVVCFVSGNFQAVDRTWSNSLLVNYFAQ